MINTKRPFGLLMDTASKALLAITLVFTGTYALALAPSLASVAHAASAVNVWWPAQNVTLDGTQPFKAVVDGMNVSNYQMFWQVDNGSLVQMNDNQADYPHKEAPVDLSGWNWSSTGTYNVTFVAKDLAGNEIGRTNVVIRHGQASTAPSTTSTQVTVAPTATTVAATQPAQTTTSTTQNTIVTANPTAPAITTATAGLTINVWGPTANSNLTGVQPIKAVLGSNLSAYKMYWSVDGGNLNEMTDNYTGAPHKEATIDFTNWHWKGNSAYVMNVIAKDLSGNVIARKDVPVYVNATQTTQTSTATVSPAPVTTTAQATTVQTTTVPTTATAASGALYVDPNNPAKAQAAAWAASRPADSAVMAKMGAQPAAIWLGGWNANVTNDVKTAMSAAAAQNAVATFVAYNIPGRDCGSYSAGGASDSSSYLTWIKGVSAGLGTGKAILVLEPDGIASIDCLSSQQQSDRYSMLSQALDIFKASNPGTKVYVDAGHSGWVDASTMAGRLKQAGVSKAAGFSLNVSNFVSTPENVSYGQAVSNQIGGAHFVVDTSRNGNGSNGEWCNPSGRALGQAPTLSTGNSLVDAYLWVKRPGESDGNCNGGPSAGNWWADYALGLAKSAGY